MSEIDTSKTVKETWDHITFVQAIMDRTFAEELLRRAAEHDESKLFEPELSLFAEWGPKLKELEYGSDEYMQAIEHMGQALQHHYQNNSHHPEHYEDGILGMNLFDLLEMMADWKAAIRRMPEGNFKKSLEFNRDRFKVPYPLFRILLNTAIYLKWIKNEAE